MLCQLGRSCIRLSLAPCAISLEWISPRPQSLLALKYTQCEGLLEWTYAFESLGIAFGSDKAALLDFGIFKSGDAPLATGE